jgi:hypothetical protein
MLTKSEVVKPLLITKQDLRNWHCGKVRSWALALQKYGRLAQLKTKTM